eukprot:Sspe_Gene.92623::Locus_65224_Transcript_1_3_Confidence_0.714_Length_456::g.92623::m.92623
MPGVAYVCFHRKAELRAAELQRINKLLGRYQRSSLVEIHGDGHCLFRSIAHQLHATGRPEMKLEELRKMCAEELRRHRGKYLPFMVVDGEEDATESLAPAFPLHPLPPLQNTLMCIARRS